MGVVTLLGMAHLVAEVSKASVREAAAEVAGRATETTCLVFGPESSGLTQDELAACGHRVLIPAHPDQPSLNLSHAVMIAAYEVFRAGTRPAPTTPVTIARN